MDVRVQALKVVPQVEFGVGGSTIKSVSYTFYVSGHGPFILTYPEGEDTVSVVDADITKQVQKLQALGAIS
jgi:hypothetical protein